MKKILLALALLASTPVFAHGYWQHHGGYRGYYGGSWSWVAPAVIGGVIVYEATKPPVVIQQPPQSVIIQQPTPQQNCSPWTEIQNPDGTITRTRTCTQ